MTTMQLVQIKVRLPGELRDWLAIEASANRRSMTSEMIVMLEAIRKAAATAQKAKGHTAPTVAPSCESTPSKEDGTQNEC